MCYSKTGDQTCLGRFKISSWSKVYIGFTDYLNLFPGIYKRFDEMDDLLSYSFGKLYFHSHISKDASRLVDESTNQCYKLPECQMWRTDNLISALNHQWFRNIHDSLKMTEKLDIRVSQGHAAGNLRDWS